MNDAAPIRHGYPTQVSQPATLETVASTTAAGEARATAPFTEADVRARLNVSSPELVKELHENAIRMLNAECERQKSLEAKASSLLAASGLAVTLTFAFGSAITERPGNFHEWIIYPYASACIFGLLTAGYAVWALMIRNYAALNEETIFNDAVIKDADEPAAFAADDTMPYTEKWSYGLRNYRAFVVPHIVRICQINAAHHKRKAELIAWGQRLFFGFILSVISVCLLIAVGLSYKNGHGETPASKPSAGTASEGHSAVASGTSGLGVVGSRNPEARSTGGTSASAAPQSASAGTASEKEVGAK
jgi:hypothetical protein